MMRAREEDGFTLVELLVAMAITVIVFGATLTVLDIFQSNNRFDQLRNENQDNARTAIDRLSRQLRDVIARTTSTGIVPGALEEAEPYWITFETVDTTKATSGANANNAMRVRYCLDDSSPTNEILWEQIRRWEEAESPKLPSSTACPDLTAGDWSTTTKAVQNVTNKIGGRPNQPLFVYSAHETPEILSVEMNLLTNVNPGHPRPGESQLTSGVSLRNANRQPDVAFTATAENEYVKLNASASRDPDGLALTYKWKEDTKVLETTSQQYTSPEKLSAGSHIFKLEVTNPGGLSACSEVKEVTKSSSAKESSEISCPI
ncbi:MAG: prepilin-type N-terminal cleavage/methylation domain-containing protein [Solirubrobacteraceae bacterium]